MNVDDGLVAVTLGEAAHKSIETGRPVELASLVPDDVWQEIRAGRAARRQRRKETLDDGQSLCAGFDGKL